MNEDLAGALYLDTSDARPWLPATVLSIDDAAARITVAIDDTEVTLRRTVGVYRAGDTVAVWRDPGRTGAGQFIAGVLGPNAPVWSPGTVTSINTGTNRLTVTLDALEGASVTVPHGAGTYTVGARVIVLLDFHSGMGHVVLTTLGNPPPPPPPPPPPTPPPPKPTERTYTAVIRPTWSGTYRVNRAAWDRWNTGTYGGRSDLYQDGSSSSGDLIGLATYGAQIVALGATAITAVTVALVSNGSGLSGSAWTATVQGSASASQPAGAPAFTGATASGSVAGYGGVGKTTSVALGATMRDGLRTGAIRSLGLVGSGYGGVYGTGRADGMALAVTYSKPV